MIIYYYLKNIKDCFNNNYNTNKLDKYQDKNYKRIA